MEPKKMDLMITQRGEISAKKPWQTPRLTCETEANSAQKIPLPIDVGVNGPS
jgi:hypothetical protein